MLYHIYQTTDKSLEFVPDGDEDCCVPRGEWGEPLWERLGMITGNGAISGARRRAAEITRAFEEWMEDRAQAHQDAEERRAAQFARDTDLENV